MRNGDPHICEKPPDAYYAEVGRYFHADFKGDGIPPEFLFDVSHEDDTINWGNGFKGTVPVCFIIDDKGAMTDIHFPQSPGKELEERLKNRVSGLRYRPGYIGHDGEKFVRCQLEFDFLFQ